MCENRDVIELLLNHDRSLKKYIDVITDCYWIIYVIKIPLDYAEKAKSNDWQPEIDVSLKGWTVELFKGDFGKKYPVSILVPRWKKNHAREKINSPNFSEPKLGCKLYGKRISCTHTS